MADSYRVRCAAISDAAEIAQLSLELGYPSSVDEMTLRLAALLPQSNQFIAVAVADGELLGWIAAERRLLLESGEKVEIVGLIVSRSARRSGVGRALVTSAEQWASRQGINTIAVRSNTLREESHPFYESNGYIRRKTQHSYIKAIS